MADLLSTIRAEIEARMRELEPALAEYEGLSSAAEALVVEVRTATPAREARAVTPAREARAATPTRERSLGKRPLKSGPAEKRPAEKRPTERRPIEKRPTEKRSPERRPAERRAAEEPGIKAILAALEHGSHTVSELVIVTALPAGDIRQSARRLLGLGAIAKTEREGKLAYALSRRAGT